MENTIGDHLIKYISRYLEKYHHTEKVTKNITADLKGIFAKILATIATDDTIHTFIKVVISKFPIVTSDPPGVTLVYNKDTDISDVGSYPSIDQLHCVNFIRFMRICAYLKASEFVHERSSATIKFTSADLKELLYKFAVMATNDVDDVHVIGYIKSLFVQEAPKSICDDSLAKLAEFAKEKHIPVAAVKKTPKKPVNITTIPNSNSIEAALKSLNMGGSASSDKPPTLPSAAAPAEPPTKPLPDLVALAAAAASDNAWN